MACCSQLKHYGFVLVCQMASTKLMKPVVQKWPQISSSFCFFLDSERRLQFEVETGSTSWSLQWHLLASRNQYEHSKRHYSMSNNGSCYVNFARPNAAQRLGRVLTLCQWALVWMRNWDACEVEWFTKLKVSVLLRCISALMECLLSNQTAWLEVSAV